MNPQLINSIVNLAVSTGVGAVVGNAVKAGLPTNASALTRVLTGVGGLVLSGMTSDHATRYAGEQVKNTVAQIKAVKDSRSKND